MTATTPPPASEPLEEARRLNALAESAGITARLLGGAAVAISAGRELPVPLQRPYKDLDYVVSRRCTPQWRAMLEANGYEADTQFNSLHGSQRLLHYDTANGRQLDTFVSTFSMCHSIELEDRLPVDLPTLAPEDILLTKLQIFEVNDKDLIDTIALLLSHPVVSGDQSGINRDKLAKVVGSDWGWHTTISDNLAKVAQRLPSVGIAPEQRATVEQRIHEVDQTLAAAPKTLKWRARAKVGRRLPWYDLPEEVD